MRIAGAPDLNRPGETATAANQTASAERLIGFETEVAGFGEPVEALIEAGAFTYRSGFDAAERLLSAERPPTAIFASNDDMAAAAIAAAHRRGLEVPRDLTVVGFDDTPVAQEIWPALTTIRQPVAEMAEQAVRLLAEGGVPEEEGEGGLQHLISHELIVRDSSAAP